MRLGAGGPDAGPGGGDGCGEQPRPAQFQPGSTEGGGEAEVELDAAVSKRQLVRARRAAAPVLRLHAAKGRAGNVLRNRPAAIGICSLTIAVAAHGDDCRARGAAAVFADSHPAKPGHAEDRRRDRTRTDAGRPAEDRTRGQARLLRTATGRSESAERASDGGALSGA